MFYIFLVLFFVAGEAFPSVLFGLKPGALCGLSDPSAKADGNIIVS
jgi:hypothetical protein